MRVVLAAWLIVAFAAPAFAQAPALTPPEQAKLIQHLRFLRDQYENEMARAGAALDALRVELAKAEAELKKKKDPPKPEDEK